MTPEEKEKQTLILLELVIHLIMTVETLEIFQIESHYNKGAIKNRIDNLLKILVPIAERDYAVVFSNGEQETIDIMREYKELILSIRDFNVPQKVILNQMIVAFNYDKKTIEATTHRILKKYNKSLKS